MATKAWVGAYARSDMGAWSRGLPVLDIGGHWQRGYRAGARSQRAYQAGLAEAGLMWAGPSWPGVSGPWYLGAVARWEAFVEASGSAAQLVYHYQSQVDPSRAQTFDGRTQFRAWQGQGISLQTPHLAWRGISLSVTAQWLSLQRLRQTSTAGQVNYQGGGAYDDMLSLSDAAHDAAPSFELRPRAQGRGSSLSLSLRWQATATIAVDLSLRDAWSRLSWDGVNRADAAIDTRVSARTADGYLDYQPALQGHYAHEDIRVRIPPSTELQATWAGPGGHWMLRTHRRWGLQQAWIGWRSPGDVPWSLALEPRFRAVQAGVSWHGWSVALMLDGLSNGAHVRQGQLSYAWSR